MSRTATGHPAAPQEPARSPTRRGPGRCGNRCRRRGSPPPGAPNKGGASLPPRVATRADGLALELGAWALHEYDEAVKALSGGLTYEAETVSGAILQRARPEAAIADAPWEQAARMLEAFRLTPASQ